MDEITPAEEALIAPEPAPPAPKQWTLLDVILLSIGTAGATIAAFLAARLSTPEGMEELNLSRTMAIMLGVQGLLILVAFGAGMLWRRMSFREAGFRTTRWYWPLIAVGSSLALLPIRIMIAGMVLLLMMLVTGQDLEALMAGQEAITAAITLDPYWLIPVIIFAGGILVPFAEELIFRGVIYGWLRKHTNVWVSVLISSALFGALHVFPPTAIAAFILGIAMALAYEYSESLWTPIIIHAVNNTVLFVSQYALLIMVDLFELPVY